MSTFGVFLVCIAIGLIKLKKETGKKTEVER